MSEIEAGVKTNLNETGQTILPNTLTLSGGAPGTSDQEAVQGERQEP